MSQEDIDNISDILIRLQELEEKIKDYESCKKEFDELKNQVEELINLDLAPIHEHIRRWDIRDVYFFRTRMFIKKYIYRPIHIGIKTAFLIAGRLTITLMLGVISGILLNILGLGTLFKNIINFFSYLFH